MKPTYNDLLILRDMTEKDIKSFYDVYNKKIRDEYLEMQEKINEYVVPLIDIINQVEKESNYFNDTQLSIFSLYPTEAYKKELIDMLEYGNKSLLDKADMIVEVKAPHKDKVDKKGNPMIVNGGVNGDTNKAAKKAARKIFKDKKNATIKVAIKRLSGAKIGEIYIYNVTQKLEKLSKEKIAFFKSGGGKLKSDKFLNRTAKRISRVPVESREPKKSKKKK